MFGLINKTLNKTLSFGGNIGAFGVNLAIGFVEEVTFNITNVGEAGAAMISDNIPTPTVDPFVCQTTSLTVASIITSPCVRKKAFEIISDATFNII
jgi:hypothetical protein